MIELASSKERAALLGWLNDQRSHVFGVVKGLPEEALIHGFPATDRDSTPDIGSR